MKNSNKLVDETKTHWKQNFNYDYLGAYSLEPGQECILTIKDVRKQIVKGTHGQKEECTIAVFNEAVNGETKPMILNKTNCKVIEKLYKTPYIEDWTGKKITIYVQDGIKAFGEVVDALRIRQSIPSQRLTLDPSSPKWEKAKERVKAGVTFEEISKHYDITPENYKKLCS